MDFSCGCSKKGYFIYWLFPEGISLGEDVIVWAKLACLYKIAYSKSNLALYRRDSSCYLSVKKNMQPAIKEDYVGIELWRLNCSYQIKDLDNYVYLWYKIRFVIFVFDNDKKSAFLEYIRLLSWGLLNLDCNYHLFLNCLPYSLLVKLNTCVRRIFRKKFDIILDYGRKPTYRIQRVMA